jgi:uncharacterized protein YbaR (Trm112 family)
MAPLRADVLALLACPVSDCHGPLQADTGYLVCTRCGRRYAREADWPVLIPEEATPGEPPESNAASPRA